MLRKALIGTAATGAAVLTTFAFASPAMAGQNAQVWTYYGTIDRGVADWVADGDKLTVCDTSADGWGVKGDVYSSPQNGATWQYEFTVTDSNSSDGCKSGTKNVTDGYDVRIRVWQYQGDSIYDRNTAYGVA